MSDTYQDGFNATQSTEGESAEKKAEGIVPVLVKQILNSPEGNFQMFDITFSMVYIKAIVRNIETSSTKITYLLEDSTGRINAHYWLEEGDTLKAPDVMLNKYATVYGSVRSQGGQKTLMVFKMLPVKDPNELVTHILEVLNACCIAEEYTQKSSGYANSEESTRDPSSAGNDLGLDEKQLAVFQAIKNHHSTDGISRTGIKRKFTHMSDNDLNISSQDSLNASLLCSKALIDGKWVPAVSGQTFDVKNPANGQIICCVPNMNEKDVQLAINAAKKAFYSDEWCSLTAKQRSQLLKNWYHLIEKNTQEIAEIMTAESGKPIVESKGEVFYGNAFIEWFAEEARRIYGEIVPAPLPNRELIVMKQPLGVAALITPWNFPLAMITRKAGAALAAGCTVVIKPAEDTPLTALAVAKLAEEAGIPKGVVNVVTSNKAAPIGELFCKSPDIQGISFTGSTEEGRILIRQSADSIKRVSLELGGNAPFIVFDSANLEKAVDDAMASKFRSCGQFGVSPNRFFIQEGIYDKFVAALKGRVQNLKIGPGDKDTTQIGPLVNEMQFNKVSAFVEDARDKNADIICGGKPLKELGNLFYEPTIVTNIPQSAKIYTEEVFGPVVSIIKFKTEEEALEKANESRRGLAGYFYSDNIQQIFRVAKRLEVGMVGVNEGLISAAEAPFGGIKESGIGREGCHHGIDEYTEIKYICMGNLKYN